MPRCTVARSLFLLPSNPVDGRIGRVKTHSVGLLGAETEARQVDPSTWQPFFDSGAAVLPARKTARCVLLAPSFAYTRETTSWLPRFFLPWLRSPSKPKPYVHVGISRWSVLHCGSHSPVCGFFCMAGPCSSRVCHVLLLYPG